MSSSRMISPRARSEECHLDGLALLAHLFIEFPLGVGLHPDNDFAEHVDCLINRVAVTLPQKASQRCQPPAQGLNQSSAAVWA
jgi:hypothetical protein